MKQSRICPTGKKRWLALVCAVILFCCAVLPVGFAETETRRIVRVGGFPYEDQLMADENGNYSGYGYDYLVELARYTDWQYEFVDVSWNDALEMLARGEVDLLGAVMRSPEREAQFAFSDEPMISGYGVLATSLSNSELPYEDFAAFDGLRVGVMRGNQHLQTFVAFSQTHGFDAYVSEYGTQEELDAALAAGEVDAIIMTNLLRAPLLRVIAEFGENDGYFAVTEGDAALLDELNDAMRRIRLDDPYFNSRLDQKYYDLQTATAVSFTRQEQAFIDHASPIPCVYIPGAMPISAYNPDTKTTEGIAVDVLALLEKRTGLQFEWLPVSSASEAVRMLRDGEAMLLPAKYYDANWARQNGVQLTEAYLTGQMVLVTGGRLAAGPEVIALYEEESQHRIIAEHIPADAEIRQYDTILECMEAVRSGEADRAFINSTIASYLMNDPAYSHLITTPLYGYPADIAMAVSGQADPRLLSVLNKGLHNISSTEINWILLGQITKGQRSPVATYFYLHPEQVVLTIAAISMLLVGLLLSLLLHRYRSNRQLSKTLYTDQLTGDPNYQALSREVPRLVGDAPQKYLLIYLDIHRFKVINDTFGYETGDRVLMATSDVLRSFIAQDERFARVYADTFVLILRNSPQVELQKRLDCLSGRLAEISLENDAVRPLFCGGVYPLPANYENIDRACDRANYAKDSIAEHFSNVFVFYDDVMRRRVLAEKELEASMSGALEREEFIAYYQPKVNTITGKVAGAEALVRWQHPEKGLLMPAEFLPFYERNGFIVRIDLSIFEQVCRHIGACLEKGTPVVPVSVNFSRRNMLDHELPQKLKRIADRYHTPPHLLEVEVTETEELEDVETAVAFVDALKGYGFGVSIDDYGTGYSSISFLQQLPLDALKLDRKFIMNAMKSDKARDVMRFLVTAMQRNGIRVVCEGIETTEQRDFIVGLNCRLVQGFYYSGALEEQAFEQYLLGRGVDDLEMLDSIPIITFSPGREIIGVEDLFAKSMPSWIVWCLAQADFPVQYISPSFLEGMGYSAAEFEIETGMRYLNWVHPEDHAAVQGRLKNRDLQEISLQYRLRRNDGSFRWVRETGRRLISETGQEILFSACTDVTDIVLLQNEKSRLIDAVPGGVGTLLLTAAGPVVQQATDRFYEVIGQSPETMAAVGNNLFPFICEKDLPGMEIMLTQVLGAGKSNCECSFRVRHSDGSLHWLALRGSVFQSPAGLQITVIAYNSDREMSARQTADRARAKLELALELTGQAMFDYDISSKTIYSHSGFSRYGIPDGTTLVVPELMSNNFIHPDDVQRVREANQELMRGQGHLTYEIRVRSQNRETDAAYTWVRITLSSVFDEENNPVQAVGVVENINAQKRFELAFLQETQYRRAFTESSLMAYELNLTRDTIQRISGSRGFRLEELSQQLPHPGCYSELHTTATPYLVVEEDRERFLREHSREALLQRYRSGRFETEVEYRRMQLDGQALWTSVMIYLLIDQLSGDVMGYAYHRDIHERKEAERGLADQAARDPLTGAYNRATAQVMIQEYLESAPEGQTHALLMLDLDHFKMINDTYGHLVGDQCLIALAQEIQTRLMPEDIVGRMGGDEFAVLLKDLPGVEKAAEIAEKLVGTIAQLAVELGIDAHTGVSIGIAAFPRNGTDFETLYRRADAAMYRAKRRTDMTVVVCTDEDA